MGFVWMSKKPIEGVASIYESYITLNKAASSHFENAYGVMLGIDPDRLKIAIKPVSKDDVDTGVVPDEKLHKISVKGSYARVSNKKFLLDVAQIANIKLDNSNSLKFKSYWNKEDHLLIIDLKQPEV